MRLFVILMTALFSTLAVAHAQEGLSGPTLFEGGSYTGDCTMISGERPNYYCLHLGCDAGRAPYFALLSGAPTITSDVTLAMRESGRGLPALQFSTDHAYDGDAYIWVAPYDPARHRAILRAMDRGAALDMLLAGPGGHDSWRGTLADARGKVAGVLGACAAPGSAPGALRASARPPAPEPMPAEAEAILKDIRHDCASRGGRIQPQPDFAQRPDLNGDGRPDLMVSYIAAECTAGGPLNCGSGGCYYDGF
ncbi:MAG TPA: hypothetical protein ENK83_04030, partial [Aliiroseovarius sp.]|nr:hypothetical protein [Aliiroseovarius sp.]